MRLGEVAVLGGESVEAWGLLAPDPISLLPRSGLWFGGLFSNEG